MQTTQENEGDNANLEEVGTTQPDKPYTRTQTDVDNIGVESTQDVNGNTILTVTFPPPEGCPKGPEQTMKNVMGAGDGSNAEKQGGQNESF